MAMLARREATVTVQVQIHDKQASRKQGPSPPRKASAHDLQMLIHGARNTSLTSVAYP
jgi:hypothetical protein